MARHDFWIDRLSERLDGTLPDEQRLAVEEHLAACADCRRVADDLAEVKRRARAMGGIAPPRDLWPEIRDRLDADPDVVDLTLRLEPPVGGSLPAPTRRGGTGWRTAATVALMAATGVGGWGLRAAFHDDAAGADREAAAVEAPGETGIPGAAFVADGVDAAVLAGEVSRLEGLLNDDPAGLDPETIQVLRKNLAIIQTAVAESRAALARDPDNAYVRRHLEGAVARQRDFLRQATSILAADD